MRHHLTALAIIATLAVPSVAGARVLPVDTDAVCSSPVGADYIDPACQPDPTTVLCGWRLTIDYIDFACNPWWAWAR